MAPLITQALSQLDPADNAHWTADGMPRMDVVEKLVGDSSITRKNVTDAAPDFTRDTATELAALEAMAQKEKAEAEAEVKPEVAEKPIEAPIIEQPTEPAPEPTSECASGACSLSEAVAADDPVKALGELSEAQEVYILDMPLPEVCSTLEGMEAWQIEANVLSVNWQKEKSVLDTRINKLAKLSASITARQQRMRMNEPNHDTAPIRAYLKRQAEVREQRAKRAQAFIDRGINQGDLTALISGKAKIDIALNQRKPAPGSTRPSPRMPVRGLTRGI